MENLNHLDVKAYIDSGILELYALEMLSTSEITVVDFILSFEIELGEELERIYLKFEQEAEQLKTDFAMYLQTQASLKSKKTDLIHKIKMAALRAGNWFPDKAISIEIEPAISI